MEKGNIITLKLDVQYDDDEHGGMIFKKKKTTMKGATIAPTTNY
jgi:hypothetical protein